MGLGSLLGNLPSRGTLTDSQGVVVTKAPTHVCDYDTSPPPDQIIMTDPTNILIRALTSKRNKESQKATGSGAKDPKGKRPAESMEGGSSAEASNKRERRDGNASEAGGLSSRPGGSSNPKISKAELESFTVEKLRSFLKDRGLSLRGRKEELLARAKRALGYR